MIYETTHPDSPILQGDIFLRLPRTDISLSSIALLEDKDLTSEVKWEDIKDLTNTLTAVLPIRAVTAIVITQNCDNARGAFISFCQIDPFTQVYQDKIPKDAKKWQSLITKNARMTTRYFYLPEAPDVGIKERMAVDFRLIFQMQREELEKYKALRSCRLNAVASEHFRETLAQYFRRYAYDEWYPLDKEEFKVYSENFDPRPKPFPWQEDK